MVGDDIDLDSVKSAYRIAMYHQSSAYQHILKARSSKDSIGDIAYKKEYTKISNWIKKHKKPMPIGKMIPARIFNNATDRDKCLKLLTEEELGMGFELSNKEKVYIIIPK